MRRAFPQFFSAVVVLITVIVSLMSTLAVSAAVVVANVLVDPVPGVCATTGSGQCSLREAVIYANSHPNTTINLLAGTYSLAIPPGASNDATMGSLKIAATTTISTLEDAQIATIDGGGLDRVFHIMAGANATLMNTVIRNGNAGDSNGGGGILNEGSLTLTHSVLANNRAGYGGGIATDGASLTISAGSAVSNNSAIGSGGGIYGGVILIDSTISGNAAAAGGGVFGGAGNATFTRSTISNNAASSEGGGIRNSGGGVSIKNSTISGNTSPGNGAALRTSGDSTFSFLTDVTVVDNSSGLSSGAVVSGGITLTNTLLANAGLNCAGAITSNDYNISSDACPQLTMPHDQRGVNPLLGPLAYTGGLTQTHDLLPGSPAIDAGACVGGITTDQRGIARPQGAACDIGAVEYVPQAVMPPGRANPPGNGAPPPMPPPRSSGGGGAGSGGGSAPNPLPPSR